MKHFVLSFSLFFFVFSSYSQVDFEPHGSFKVEIGLPNNISNKGFKELVQGLAVITPSYQYTFTNTFSVGAGLRYGYFNVNEFKNNINLQGGLHMAGAFVKVGQEKYYGNFGVDYGVRIGYMMNFFTTNINKEELGGPYIDNAGFVEPTIGISLKGSEKASYSLALGYAIHMFKFSPHQVGIEEFSGIPPSKLNSLTSYITVSFGYSYFFGK